MGKERVWTGCEGPDGNTIFEEGRACEVWLDDEGFYVIDYCSRHWATGSPLVGDSSRVPRFARRDAERTPYQPVWVCPQHGRIGEAGTDFMGNGYSKAVKDHLKSHPKAEFYPAMVPKGERRTVAELLNLIRIEKDAQKVARR